MTHRVSIKNWNTNRSWFYNFYTWRVDTGLDGNTTVRKTIETYLLEHNAQIIYEDNIPYVEFESVDSAMHFILRWS